LFFCDFSFIYLLLFHSHQLYNFQPSWSALFPTKAIIISSLECAWISSNHLAAFWNEYWSVTSYTTNPAIALFSLITFSSHSLTLYNKILSLTWMSLVQPDIIKQESVEIPYSIPDLNLDSLFLYFKDSGTKFDADCGFMFCFKNPFGKLGKEAGFSDI